MTRTEYPAAPARRAVAAPIPAPAGARTTTLLMQETVAQTRAIGHYLDATELADRRGA